MHNDHAIIRHKRIIYGAIAVLIMGIVYIRSDLPKRLFELASIISKESARPLCKDCNVLLVTIDSCSARNIPCYGYSRNTMPNFCSLASENILFANSYANAPWTLPSHVTIFTGLLPSNHHVNNVFTDPLSESIPLLSDVFHSNGYETLFYMPAHNEILSDSIIYNRGMTKLVDNVGTVDDDIDGALHELQENSKKGKKTFLSFYSQQCHYPYLLNGKKKQFTDDTFPEIPIDKSFAPIPFTEKFYHTLLQTSYVNMNKSKNLEGGSYAFYRLIYDWLHSAGSYEIAKNTMKDIQMNPDFDMDLYRAQYFEYYYSLAIDPTDTRRMEYVRALYDQILYELDRGVIAKIATAFRNTSLKSNTILLITSEHGESFGEHNTYGHTTLYDENIRVPFMMRVPNILPMHIADPVQSADIMPTLLELVGIHTSSTFDGMSLVSAIKGKHITDRLISADSYLTAQYTKTIRSKDWKVFVSSAEHYIPYMLFHTLSDPNEMQDVLTSNVSTANSLLDRFQKTNTAVSN